MNHSTSLRPRALTAMLTLALLMPALGQAANKTNVSESDQWQREFAASERVVVRNVWGRVEVTEYDGDTILVNAAETRTARSDRMLEASRELLYLNIDADADELLLEVTGPPHNRKRNHCQGCQLTVEFELQVPRGTALDLGSVDEGSIVVRNASGPITANHVNGSIDIDGAHQCNKLNTVNGKIDITFAVEPQTECDLSTVNGDMIVSLPQQASAGFAFDLMNGEVSTDFEVQALALPANVQRQPDGAGTRYKIRRAVGVEIGNGGNRLDFRSINGDVLIEQLD